MLCLDVVKIIIKDLSLVTQLSFLITCKSFWEYVKDFKELLLPGHRKFINDLKGDWYTVFHGWTNSYYNYVADIKISKDPMITKISIKGYTIKPIITILETRLCCISNISGLLEKEVKIDDYDDEKYCFTLIWYSDHKIHTKYELHNKTLFSWEEIYYYCPMNNLQREIDSLITTYIFNSF